MLLSAQTKWPAAIITLLVLVSSFHALNTGVAHSQLSGLWSAWKAACMWHLHNYTLWSHMHQGLTGTTRCNVCCPHSGINRDKKPWKTHFPSPASGSNPHNLLMKGVCTSGSAFSLARMGSNCGQAPLGSACPEPDCNRSKACCSTSLVTLNKFKSRSASNKL